jgi:hypothetical protein
LRERCFPGVAPAANRQLCCSITARGPDGGLDPDAIAQTYLHLHRQHRSAWASQIELRPWVEKF